MADYLRHSQIVGDVDLQSEKSRRIRLALRVGFQRKRSPAPERPVEQEVQRADVRKLKSLDVAQANSGEMLFDSLGRHFADEDWIVIRSTSDQADIGCVAFISRSGVCDLEELDLQKVVSEVR